MTVAVHNMSLDRWRKAAVLVALSAFVVGLSACAVLDEIADTSPSETAAAETSRSETSNDETASTEKGDDEPGSMSIDAAEQPSETIVGPGRPIRDVRVVDGDSVDATYEGNEIEIRLAGYNAPELFDDNNTRTCIGTKATEALEKELEANDLVLIAEDTDRYGRTLGEIGANQRAVTPTLIRSGWGFATGDNQRFRLLMVEAAEERLGMWGEVCGQPVVESIVIGEVVADAEGNDRYNLNGEWVRLDNIGDVPIDLSGWTLRDDTTGHRFALEGVVEPGGSLEVRSGLGASTEDELFLDESFPVWSNDQETVVVIDPNGVFVHWVFLN